MTNKKHRRSKEEIEEAERGTLMNILEAMRARQQSGAGDELEW